MRFYGVLNGDCGLHHVCEQTTCTSHYVVLLAITITLRAGVHQVLPEAILPPSDSLVFDFVMMGAFKMESVTLPQYILAESSAGFLPWSHKNIAIKTRLDVLIPPRLGMQASIGDKWTLILPNQQDQTIRKVEELTIYGYDIWSEELTIYGYDEIHPAELTIYGYDEIHPAELTIYGYDEIHPAELTIYGYDEIHPAELTIYNLVFSSIVEFPTVFFTTFKAMSIESDDVPPSSQPSHSEEATKEAGAGPLTNHTAPACTLRKHMSKKPARQLKEETLHWFQNTQRRKLIINGEYPDWFHGFLTRKRAEEILQDKPLGCFLIRFCESRVGYVLSYRGSERCRHFMLDQLKDEKYVIEGEDSTHSRLEDLLNHYRLHPVKPYKELLTAACVKTPTAKNSEDMLQNSIEVPRGDHKYDKVIKPCPNPTEKQPQSPKERKNTPPKDMIKIVNDGPSFPSSVPDVSVKDHIKPGPKQPSDDYSPIIKKCSGSHTQTKNEKILRDKEYGMMEEFHTYSEPAICTTQDKGNAMEREHPIAFYAVGRGSCKESMENIYSEVDNNCKTSSGFQTKTHKQAASATLPHPTSRAPPNKKTAFHSSFRANKCLDPSAAGRSKAQEIARKAYCKSKVKDVRT
ncbi:Hypothetical predicted protein [Pelobates cultripes]|uniref:SH2 domain-containing protein n=1 Tax=Pelobates cultripes TaxID=61616 RepID=A0AAD1TGJ9_PELCU|nr:Hypothetical predicted protein [Pelobates cultripes]